MRNTFANVITDLAKIDERIVMLSGDIGNKLFDRFKEVDPDRFFNCGVAEANMMGVAAGLAMNGFRPVVYTITPFTTTRCFEQIRVDVCYHKAPVIIVGTGSGLSYAELGPTHHSLEDMAILRTLPGMQVLAPCDAFELKNLLPQVLNQPYPCYIRIGKKGEPDISQRDVTLGKARILKEGKDIALLCAGTLMPEIEKTALLLEQDGLSVELVSFHTVKPLDKTYLHEAFNKFKCILTFEEHGLIGGLGSAIAEWKAQKNAFCPLFNFGTPDTFMHEGGSQNYARHKYGLTALQLKDSILNKLKETSNANWH